MTYMSRAMRLLLLLSAFLTALTGVVSGAATAAEPVQASASVAQAGSRTTIAVVLPRAGEQAFAAASTWHVDAPAPRAGARSSYGERRRL